jgi:predicted AAA+ superfamily ATPase
MVERDMAVQLMADFQRMSFEGIVPRTLQVDLLPGKVASITGPRRAGKTFLLYSLAMEEERRTGHRNGIMLVSLEDERLGPLEAGALNMFLDVFLARRENRDGNPLLLLDEIQEAPEWDRPLRRLCDERRFRVAVTGSSSRLLGSELSTRLRGRTLRHELLPFSFREVLSLHGVDPADRSTETARQLKALGAEFLRWGGFPEVWTVARSDDRIRSRILREYYTMMFHRDVVDRAGVRNRTALKYLMRYLAANVATLFAPNSFHRHARSIGLAVAKDKVYSFVELLADAYMYLTVPVWSASVRRQMVLPKKVYGIDQGMMAAVAPMTWEGSGRLLENAVFLELRRRGYEVTYWKGRQECDFVAARNGEPSLVIQVTERLSSPEALGREMGGLSEARAALAAPQALLLSPDFGLPARFRPPEWQSVWRWLAQDEVERGNAGFERPCISRTVLSGDHT